MILNSQWYLIHDNVEARASIKNLDNQSSTITTLRQQDMKDKKLLQGQRLRQKSYEQRKYFSYTMNEQWYIKPSTHMRWSNLPEMKQPPMDLLVMVCFFSVGGFISAGEPTSEKKLDQALLLFFWATVLRILNYIIYNISNVLGVRFICMLVLPNSTRQFLPSKFMISYPSYVKLQPHMTIVTHALVFLTI